jgi:hypothetical protein
MKFFLLTMIVLLLQLKLRHSRIIYIFSTVGLRFMYKDYSVWVLDTLGW